MPLSFAKRSAQEAICFDLAIAVLIVGGSVSAYYAVVMLQSGIVLSSHFTAFLYVVIAVMGIGAALTAWGSIIEPNLLIIRRKHLPLKLKTPLRIAIASDFHIGIYRKKNFAAKIVRKLNSIHADIILLPGDFMDDEVAPLSDLSPLKNLRARHGIFAVTGNHDAGAYMKHFSRIPYFKKDRTPQLEKLLTSYGMTFLRNASKTLTINGEKLVIAGTDDSFMKTCDPAKALKTVPDGVPVILLSHTPDVILDPASHRANLIVSGHTHGGQIRLPFIGPLYTIPDKLGRAYDRGFFRVTKSCVLAITEGIGVTGVRARLFCPPEILVLETKVKIEG